MAQPDCTPTMAVVPLPCTPGGGSGEVAGCCSPSTTAATWCAGDDMLTVLVQSTCQECGDPAGLPAIVGWYGPGGVFTPGPPPAGAQPCTGTVQVEFPSPPEPPCATVATQTLCDITDDSCHKFLRLLVVACDGTVTATSDLEVTGQPYTPAGTVGDCGDCPCPDETKVLPLCDTRPDGTVVRFLRHITYDAETGQITSQEDLELDNTTPYTPQGEVGNCPCGPDGQPCEPQPSCARFSGIAGPDSWTLPDGVESLTISIICGQITVTDCSGEVTVVNEGCGSMSWAAPQGGGCTPNTLCTPFTVDIPESSAAYFSWIETGCGSESPGESL